MISVKFNIFSGKKPVSKSFIMFSISWDGLRYQSSTKISVNSPVNSWDYENCKVKKDYPYQSEINSKLKNYAVEIEKIYNKKTATGEKVTTLDIKDKIKEIVSPLDTITIKEERTRDFWEYFDLFLETRKQNPEIKESSIKHDTIVKRHLVAFAETKKFHMKFENIDLKFYSEFYKYLSTHSLIEKKERLRDNTIGMIVKLIKTFMTWGLDEGFHSNTKFKKIKVLTESPFPVTLTIDELEKLETLEISTQKLSRARDLFLLQCYTCLRFSDLMNLTPENFDLNQGVIRNIKTIKTSINLPDIRIHPQMRTILDRYPDLNLPNISNQKYNDNIKALCKFAEFNSEEKITMYYNRQAVSESKPKHELISSHSARRTGATLFYKSGFPIMYIMALTGHQSIKSFKKYIGIDNLEVTDVLGKGFDRDKLRGL